MLSACEARLRTKRSYKTLGPFDLLAHGLACRLDRYKINPRFWGMGCGTNIASPDFVESIAEQLQTLGTHAFLVSKKSSKSLTLPALILS